VIGTLPVKETSLKPSFPRQKPSFAEVIPGNHRVIRIDTSQSMGQRRTQLLDEIRELKDADLEHIAFFCHGWADGIQCGGQMGFSAV